MVIAHIGLTYSLHIYNCFRSSPENLIGWLVSHTDANCYMLFLGREKKSNPLTLHCIVFSWVIFIASTQTEQTTKALHSYWVQLTIAEKAIG